LTIPDRAKRKGRTANQRAEDGGRLAHVRDSGQATALAVKPNAGFDVDTRLLFMLLPLVLLFVWYRRRKGMSDDVGTEPGPGHDQG
jgi:hypothetical protein